MFTTGVLSRSLSSSSSSLDSRHGPGARPRPLPRQRLPARQRRERASLSPRATPSPAIHSSPDNTALPPAGLSYYILHTHFNKDPYYSFFPDHCTDTNESYSGSYWSQEWNTFCVPLPGLRSRTPSASSSVFEGPEVRLGERVLVVGQRTGVVQFYGKTNFAPGKLLKMLFSLQRSDSWNLWKLNIMTLFE